MTLAVAEFERAEPIAEVERPAPSPFRTAAEWCADLEAAGPRIVTGFATLDAALRGGVPLGRVGIVGGAPGAGKTTLVLDVARRAALSGVPVAVVAADEHAPGLLVRLGQAFGFERDVLEAGDRDVRSELAKALDGLPFLLVDPASRDGEPIAIGEVAEELVRRFGGPGLLAVDSIQTVRPASMGDESPRGRVDAVVGELKRAACQHGHFVFATTELARGAYRSRNAADRIDDLAAFKESGGIEYGCDFAMVLRSVKDEVDLIDVTIAKNRVGRRPPFRLRLDHARATFAEVPMPDGNDPGATTDAREERAIAEVEKKIAAALMRAVVAPKTRTEAVELVSGRAKTKFAAFTRMVADGRVVEGPDGFRLQAPTPSKED